MEKKIKTKLIACTNNQTMTSHALIPCDHRHTSVRYAFVTDSCKRHDPKTMNPNGQVSLSKFSPNFNATRQPMGFDNISA